MISHKKKFIFVHVYKTAGTSVREALKPYCVKWDERVSRRMRRFPWLSPLADKLYSYHLPASEWIRKIGEERFQSYFSFAFVRNPWDWQVSLYNFMLKTKVYHQPEVVNGISGFTQYLEWRCREEVRFQRDFVFSKDGRQLVDFIGRFENLEEDFRHVCSQIGVSAVLPKLNESGHRPYKEFYTPETIELVRRTFAADIDLFKYEFDAGTGKADAHLPKTASSTE
ncbi:MAG: sulfotransferase family 2 domain-containing protein [Fibrobacteria bacterium]